MGNFERAYRYFTTGAGKSQELTGTQAEAVRRKLHELVDLLGPVVEDYPIFHPAVWRYNREKMKHVREIYRTDDWAWKSVTDHTVLFRDGFVTCPYDNGQDVIDVAQNKYGFEAWVDKEVPLYSTSVTPVVVRCDDTDFDEMFLEHAFDYYTRWRGHAQVAETWEVMAPYFLGSDSNGRSSPFVSDETVHKMRKLHEAMMNTGLFGNKLAA